jgi:hypothetical protein
MSRHCSNVCCGLLDFVAAHGYVQDLRLFEALSAVLLDRESAYKRHFDMFRRHGRGQSE